MTREDAINELREASDSEVKYGDIEHHYNEVMKRVEALDMAIEALELCTSYEDTINKLTEAIENTARAKGEWIKSSIPGSVLSECNICGFHCGSWSFEYCPMCGAKMERWKVRNKE